MKFYCDQFPTFFFLKANIHFLNLVLLSVFNDRVNDFSCLTGGRTQRHIQETSTWALGPGDDD